jgi:tetratricopeptide (TPR) repeat protein
VIVNDLCEKELLRPRKTEPLKGAIDKLNKEEKVPSNIIASMLNLNSLSAFGAHPKDFDPEQVRPVLINLTTIIKWYLKYKAMVAGVSETKTVDQRIPEQPDTQEQTIPRKRYLKIPITIGSAIVVIIIVLIFTIDLFNIFSRNRLENLRSKGKISIAVLPFQNFTNDTRWNSWPLTIQSTLTSELSQYQDELSVRGMESIEYLVQSQGLTDYASISPSVGRQISKKLNADFFITGSITTDNVIIRIDAQLIDTKTGAVLHPFRREVPYKKEINLQTIDALSEEVENYLMLSQQQKKLPDEQLSLVSTSYHEAYRAYIEGKNAWGKGNMESASQYLSEAVRIDSNFSFAAILLGWTYLSRGMPEEAKECILKVYKKIDQIPSPHVRTKLKDIHALFTDGPAARIKYLKELPNYDDQDPHNYSDLGSVYNTLGRYDEAIPELKKALGIYENWGVKPFAAFQYNWLGRAYHETGQYRKEKKLYRKAEKDFPDAAGLIQRQAILFLSIGNTSRANEYIEKYKSVRKDNSATEASITNSLANIYRQADSLDKAEEYYREVLDKHGDTPQRMYRLAWFLIDTERDIGEGIQLIDKVLDSIPDNWRYLDTKGWGLFKQGDIEQAMKFLNKSDSLMPIYNHRIYLHKHEVEKALAALTE